MNHPELSLPQARRVLECLHQHAESGVGLFAVALEARVSANQISRFIRKHPDMVASSSDGKPGYRLNQRGRFRGSIEQMLEHLEEKEKQRRAQSSNMMWWVMILLLILPAFIAVAD